MLASICIFVIDNVLAAIAAESTVVIFFLAQKSGAGGSQDVPVSSYSFHSICYSPGQWDCLGHFLFQASWRQWQHRLA